MKPSKILLAARERIAAPGAWTQNAFARGRNGECVESGSDYAVCWCTAGALMSVCPHPEEAFWYLERVTGNAFVSVWNDAPGRTQLEVVVALEQAALLAQSEWQ